MKIYRIENIAPTALFFTALACLTLVKLLLILYTPFELAPDEAYYWEWSRHLDWAYVSKGPVIALLIKIGVDFFGTTTWAVRVPALFCATLMWIVLYLIIRSETNSRRACLFTLALLSTPFFFALGLGMTTDAPCFLFWLLSLFFTRLAVKRNICWYWIPSFIALGLAILSKYTAIIGIFGVAAAIVTSSKFKMHLKSSYFWIGLSFLFAELSPLLYWNYKHSWINFLHNAGHLRSSGDMIINARYFLELLGSQLGLIGPLLLVGAVAVNVFRPHRLLAQLRSEGSELAPYFISLALLALMCLFVSLTRPVYPNWPMPAYLFATVVLAKMFRLSKQSLSMRKLLVGSLCLNGLVAFLACLLGLGISFGLPLSALPTKKVIGWSQLAERIEATRSASTTSVSFIATDDCGVAAELAFYMSSHPDVVCLPTASRRFSQYDIWKQYQTHHGQSGLLVMKSKEAIDHAQRLFTRQIQNRFQFNVSYDDEVVRTFYTAEGADLIHVSKQKTERL